MSEKGWITDIKRFAVHDGPGIRTTLFVKGCPLRCLWCHNPECIARMPELGFFVEKCISCGACAAVCPAGAHTMQAGQHHFGRARCTACGACVARCPRRALMLYGQQITAEDAFARLIEDEPFYRTTGGGITLSGGEPLIQEAFCLDILSRAREKGIHTAVDTSGYAPWAAFEATLPHTNLYLYDLKHIEEEAHRRLTGVSNARILENLARLDASGAAIEIRIPLIPGLNDDGVQLRAAGTFLARLRGLTRIRVLPYHRLAHSKYAAIARHDTLPDVDAPTDAALDAAVALLRSYGLPALSGRA